MRFLKKSYVGLMFLFLYAPIAILIIFSFNASKSRGTWGGFTLDWYQKLFRDDALLTSLYNTVVIAVAAAVISTLLGTVAAIAIYRMKGSAKSFMINLTYLPILNPDIVTGIALMLLMIYARIPRGMFSMLLSHITFCVPFVVISVLPKLRQLDPRLYDAALDLGATPLKAYLSVILPEIAPGILTGLLMAFTMSIDDFVISYFTTGNGVSNLSISIYSMARRGINPKINAVLTLLFTSILILMAVIGRSMNRNTNNKNAEKKEGM